MKCTGMQTFYLAVFAAFSGVDCKSHTASSVSSQTSPDVCAVSNSSCHSLTPSSIVDNPFKIDSGAKVSDACASYDDLNKLNDKLHPYVRNLANNTDFFSYYRLNLYNKKCPFWDDENGMCGNRACAVDTVDNEEDIPEIWRAQELSKLEGPKAQHPGKKQQKERQKPLLGQLGEKVGESCVVEYDDECDERDYCVPEDESASAKGDYVSLVDNPERFTGYSGEGPHQVWESIYRENCFSRSASGGNSGSAAQELREVIKDQKRQQAISAGKSDDDLDLEDECIEKRVFHRVISGMHTSISTHLCYDYLNQWTGEWGPNLTCYKERLHNKPERISNLYFNFALVSRAVGKLRDYVQDYTFCTGDPEQDTLTKRMITTLANAIPPGPQIFDESVMFTDQTVNGISLKEDFRNRFRNVSRIMDCVGCDKCRLWGKVQTNGFGTALKVLFEFGNGHKGQDKPLLRRTELVALINTYDKISAALKAVEHFQDMVTGEQEGRSVAELEASERPVSQSEPSSSPNFDDLDELDDFSDSPPQITEQTFSESFWEEFDLVWKAYLMVLKSWASLPWTMSRLLGVEGGRLMDMWLGRPVRPRTWEIRFPGKDEL